MIFRMIVARLLGLVGYRTFRCYLPNNEVETFRLWTSDRIKFRNPTGEPFLEVHLISRDLTVLMIQETTLEEAEHEVSRR